jgi:hypothetical protein
MHLILSVIAFPLIVTLLLWNEMLLNRKKIKNKLHQHQAEKLDVDMPSRLQYMLHRNRMRAAIWVCKKQAVRSKSACL